MVEDPGRLGPYRILDALGRGSMGVVYRGRHEVDGTVVALKAVVADEPALVRALRREAHALRRIRHPGIVHVIDDGVDRGLPWYAMDFVEGTTLRQFIDAMWLPDLRRPSPSVAAGDLRRALSIVRRLCDALDFLHGEGLIHRDLKPENVILRTGEQPVIVDFGFVRAFAGARGREVVEAGGVLEVTIGYAAPEQMRGDLVDARADLYALGCILYEILTGRPVFEGGDEWELQRRHLDEQPTPPSRWVAGVPAALDELVLGLLKKEPHDRIGYAADVAAMVARMEGGAPAPDRPARVYLYRPELAGRAALLEELQRTLLEARRKRGAMVLLAGESGVGKTRLATELATFAERRGFQVVPSECAPLPAHVAAGAPALQAPLQPLQRLFQAVADECRDPDRMQEILGPHAPLLAPLGPVIAGLPGVPAAPETPRIATAETRQQTIAAITSVVRAMAARRPLVLVVDDLQWADDLTMEVLGSLARADLRGAALLVLGTYRTEETSEALVGLGVLENVRSYKLDKLDEAAVASIIGNMLAIAAPPAAFVQFLAAESGGNPFFVAEYLRTAAQVGLLDVDGRGRWQLGGAPPRSITCSGCRCRRRSAISSVAGSRPCRRALDRSSRSPPCSAARSTATS